MRKIVFLWRIIIFFCLFYQPTKANEPILKNVYSNSVFYNFYEHFDGVLYVGTSDGLYMLSNNSLKKINNEPGYVLFENGQITRSTSFGIVTNHKYKNILPVHYSEFPHQSIKKNKHIYLICRGALFTYQIKPYKFKLKGKSIRCFTDNSVGTYSGIFIKDKLIKIPNYTSGQILEKDSIFYICYDGLAIYNPNNDIKLLVRENTRETKINKFNLGLSRDIFQLNNKSFLLSTTTGLHLIDSMFVNVKTIYKAKNNLAPIIIDIEDFEHETIISFGNSNKYYRYSINQQDLYLSKKFLNPIQNGFKMKNDVVDKYALLFKNKVIIYNRTTNSQVEILGLREAHSIIAIGNETLLITTQNGAHLLFLNSNKLSPLLFDGIEFNNGALWRRGEILKLGSTNGYIEITKSELIKIQDDLNKITEKNESTTYISWIFALFALIIIILGIYVYQRFKSKFKNNVIENEITRFDIEEYIQLNLKNVSIKSIKDNFNISNKSLYEIIAPEKPGVIISNYRKLKVKDLISKKESLKTISEETGFSISYLRKLKK